MNELRVFQVDSTGRVFDAEYVAPVETNEDIYCIVGHPFQTGRIAAESIESEEMLQERVEWRFSDDSDSVLEWIRNADGDDLERVNAVVGEWLAEPADPDLCDSNYPADGYALAFAILSDDERELSSAGLRFIDGDNPGSNAQYVRLTKSVDETNQICETNGLRFRFERHSR